MPTLHLHTQHHLATLQGPGSLLVASDLHGNLEDLTQLIHIFETTPNSCLLLLGDLFHGPDIDRDDWETHYTHLGDFYEDRSADLYRCWAHLCDTHPDRVVTLLGNHDHAHIGGPTVSKFYADEAAAMEHHLSTHERNDLHRRLLALPYILATSCGACFTHAASPHTPFTLNDLAHVDPTTYSDVPMNAMYDLGFFPELLWKRSASPHETQTFLTSLHNALSQLLPAFPRQTTHTYGHDVARQGFHIEHTHLFNLSTSYSMQRHLKTYLHLDLSIPIHSTHDLQNALRPLYPNP